MSDKRVIRINKVLRELNISLDRAVEFLKTKGFEIEASPNAKISDDEYAALDKQFSADKGKKEASKEVSEEKKKEKEELRIEREQEEKRRKEEEEKRKREEENRRKEEEEKREREVIKAKAANVTSIKTVGKIDLESPSKKETVVDSKTTSEDKKEPVNTAKNKAEETEKTAVKAEKKEKKPKPEVKEAPKETPKEAVEEKNVAKKSDEKSEETTKNNDPSTDANAEPEVIKTQYQKLSGATFTGQKIDLSQFNKPKKKKEDPKKDNNKPGNNAANNKNKRKRIEKPNPAEQNQQGGAANKPQQGNGQNRQGQGGNRGGNSNFGNRNAGNKFGNKKQPVVKVEPTDEEVKNQIKETLERLQGKQNKSKAAKYRKDKRELHRKKEEEARADDDLKILKVTEFVTVGEVATMMNVPITQVIGTCMSLGIMVTMNQRLDAETLTIVADEFGYEVQFTTADIEEAIVEEVDAPEDLQNRAPIVTVMGHVDHGKTSLLDYIRKANVIAGESGGITQHIGAYGVTLENGQKITFLDTPGHEAFTAMRARGAQVTDIAIIVVAADDDIMPQTKEAISHAQAAGVPIIFAINKVDKPTANPEKIKEKLAAMNFLVEEWGGAYQSQDISAKFGQGVPELLEKVLLEAEMLELKANPNKLATGTVV